MTKLNTGLSGCKLELINGLLRKHSASTDYNSRLISQAEKQIVFSKRIYKNIETPKVHDIEESYFDMDYVSGQNFEEFFSERRLDVKVLHPAFAFPEDFASQCQFEPKIVHVSKDNSKYHQ